jgi:Holliday junction resolvase RusA-like endonuclease
MGVPKVSHFDWRRREASHVSGVRTGDGRRHDDQAGVMTFVVLGTPATKGSTVSFVGDHGIVTKTDCKGLAAWTQAVGWAAKFANVSRAQTGTAVCLTVVFQFVRPKTQRARLRPTVKPDLDKLARALLDALTGIAYDDDAQVVKLYLDKVYGEDTRTTVQIDVLGG